MGPRAFHACLLGGAAVCAAALGLTALSARGHFDDLLLFLGQLALVPAGIVGMGLLWSRRRRTWGRDRRRLDLVAACVLLAPIALVPMSVVFYKSVRGALFTGFAARAEVVVEAIERHVEERGEPPATLAGLVPEYLDTAPTTGLDAYPHFKYSRSLVGTWRLTVECSPGFAAFDEITYRPGMDVPSSHTRHGDWLYHHE